MQDVVEVGREADGDRHVADRIFENQVPADNPREDFAERGLRIGISGTRDRDHRSKLRIAEAGERADDAGDDVGDEDGGPRVERRGVTGTDEDAGADDAADAEEHEVPRPQGPFELACPRFFLDLGNALAQHHASEHAGWCGSRHYVSPKMA